MRSTPCGYNESRVRRAPMWYHAVGSLVIADRAELRLQGKEKEEGSSSTGGLFSSGGSLIVS